MSTYASFQGRVYLGKRDVNGNPIELRTPGNVAELKLALKTEVIEHYESHSGSRSLDHRMIKQKSATVTLILLAAKVIEVNADFFTRTVIPKLGSVFAHLDHAPRPAAGSTPSSS